MPWFPEVPTSGFGYPLAGSKLLLPQGPLSVPNAHELRTSELCSSRMIERRLPFPFPLLRFLTKPYKGLAPTLQRVDPTRKAVPLGSQPNFLRRVGDGALLGFTTFQVLYPKDPPREASPFTALPSRSSVPEDLTISRTGSLKVSLSPGRHLLPKRAPTCLMFPANCHTPPLKEANPPLTIFSSRGPKKACTLFGSSLRGELLPA